MRTFKSHSLSNFQIHSVVLLTSHHAAYCVPGQDVFVTGRLYLWVPFVYFTPTSPTLPPLATIGLFSVSVRSGFFFLKNRHISEVIWYLPFPVSLDLA